jgi:hypothetical protein
VNFSDRLKEIIAVRSVRTISALISTAIVLACIYFFCKFTGHSFDIVLLCTLLFGVHYNQSAIEENK